MEDIRDMRTLHILTKDGTDIPTSFQTVDLVMNTPVYRTISASQGRPILTVSPERYVYHVDRWMPKSTYEAFFTNEKQ